MAARATELPGSAPRVDVVSTWAAFEGLRDRWDDVLRNSQADCLFLTWEWLSTWWKHLGGDQALAIHTVFVGDRLVAIAPFALKPPQPFGGRLLTTMEFLGSGFAGSDYLDVIAVKGHEESSARALAAHLAGSNIALRLSNVLAPGSHTVVLLQALQDHGWKTDQVQVNVCPWIRLDGLGWNSFFAGLGSETRYNFNRKWKKLEHSFRVELHEANAETLADALATLIAHHNERWSGRGGSDAFHTDALIAFHREFTRVALSRGWLRLFTLTLNGQPAASLYGFLRGKKFYFYQSGLNRAFAKYSVGFVLMGLAIQRAASEGALEYDLLHGDESYKSHWAILQRPIYRFESYPTTLSGMTARAYLNLGRISQRLAHRVLRDTSE